MSGAGFSKVDSKRNLVGNQTGERLFGSFKSLGKAKKRLFSEKNKLPLFFNKAPPAFDITPVPLKYYSRATNRAGSQPQLDWDVNRKNPAYSPSYQLTEN
ncbi:MAG: hypothetical protein ACKOCO_16255, partial [Bacteroidota bacterium]